MLMMRGGTAVEMLKECENEVRRENPEVWVETKSDQSSAGRPAQGHAVSIRACVGVRARNRSCRLGRLSLSSLAQLLSSLLLTFPFRLAEDRLVVLLLLGLIVAIVSWPLAKTRWR